MAAIPTLSTERLILRPWRAEDIDAYADMCADPVTMRYLGAGKALERDQVAELVDRYFIEEWTRWGHGHWAVELRASGEFIGYCGLLCWKEGTPEETGEVAYGLARGQWGRGLATEAAGAAIQWGIANFDWRKVVGLTHPDNVASQRVLAKLGMAFAGEWDGPHYRMNVYEAQRNTILANYN